jgi:hypothetical protein
MMNHMNANEILAILKTLPLTTPHTGVQIDRYMVVRTSIDGFTVSSATQSITLGAVKMSSALAKRMATRPTMVTIGSTMKAESLRDTVTKAIANLHATARLVIKNDPMAVCTTRTQVGPNEFETITSTTIERLAVSVTPRDGVSWTEMLNKTATALRNAGLIAVAEHGACRVTVMPDLKLAA